MNHLLARLSPRFRFAFGFMLALTAAFLFTTSREHPANDGSYVYFTAERLVLNGTTALAFPAVAAPNGTSQSPHPILVSLVHVPGVVVKRLWSTVWRGGESPLLVLASHLAPAALAAATCWLFLQMCLLLGVQYRFALLGSMILGFGTIMWVYARSPWPSMVEAFAFTGFFHAVLCWLKHNRACDALAVGLWMAALINVKWSFVLLLPLTAAWLYWRVRTDEALQQQLIRRALPAALLGCLMPLLESKLRFGTWGFVPAMLWDEPMKQPIIMGGWGIILSPGKSLFVYSPPLVLAILGVRLLWQRKQFDFIVLALATLLPFFVYLTRLSHWTGDSAWGPRFCVFATPVLLLPAPFYLHHVWQKRRPLGLMFAASLILFGVWVQLLGNGLYWDRYLGVAKQARLAWLGVPNRSGALVHAGASDCDPCFEDIYPTTWLAPFNPIEGHAWLLRHVLRGDDATQAESDAAWHRYTRLHIPIAEPYARARFDWWLLKFFPKRPGKGIASAVGLMAMLALGLWLARGYAPPMEESEA